MSGDNTLTLIKNTVVEKKGRERIAILTDFQDFNPSYSLSGIVQDQALMLLSHGHEVTVFTSERFNTEQPILLNEDIERLCGKKALKRFTVSNSILFTHLKDYKSKENVSPEHEMVAKRMAEGLADTLRCFDIIFTHDFIFQGWFLPYALAVQNLNKHLPNVSWLHWVHSVPSEMKDWWDIKLYGKNHKIVFPNASDRIRVAEQYRGAASDVKIIPHIKDMRTWFDFSGDTCDFIKQFPSVLSADFVQVLPASTDRFKAKGVDKVCQIFGELKKRGFKVCLIIANQWAHNRKNQVVEFQREAVQNGLVIDKDLIFTSTWRDGKYVNGIPRRMVRELMQCSNLFIFPTREESFGLAIPEAMLSGCCLPVINKSLWSQIEITGFGGLYLDFGSSQLNFIPANAENYYRDLATLIIGRAKESESIKVNMFCRQRYNWDFLYDQFYAAAFSESGTWS